MTQEYADRFFAGDDGKIRQGEPVKLPQEFRQLRPWIYVHEPDLEPSEEAFQEHCWNDASGVHVTMPQCPTCGAILIPIMKWKRGVVESCPLNAPRDPKGADIGRNEPCPCGSQKKYKRCCGA